MAKSRKKKEVGSAKASGQGQQSSQITGILRELKDGFQGLLGSPR